MLLGESSIHETFYDVLSVKEDATFEEIRRSYRSAILNSHPDKLNSLSLDTPDSANNPSDKFLDIQRAWETLGNAESRLMYDNALQISRQDSVMADDVNIEEMTMVESGGEEDILELYYQCRCGDYFSVDSTELGGLGYKVLRNGNEIGLQTPDSSRTSIVLPCGSCSLRIRLWVDSDAKILVQELSK